MFVIIIIGNVSLQKLLICIKIVNLHSKAQLAIIIVLVSYILGICNLQGQILDLIW